MKRLGFVVFTLLSGCAKTHKVTHVMIFVDTNYIVVSTDGYCHLGKAGKGVVVGDSINCYWQ